VTGSLVKSRNRKKGIFSLLNGAYTVEKTLSERERERSLWEGEGNHEQRERKGERTLVGGVLGQAERLPTVLTLSKRDDLAEREPQCKGGEKVFLDVG